ncbi:hypothetical protein DPMN_137946 [Dreissena polymorpha]|uniref:Uncharacterized protein n=1 Tax=Dreissena polymorpha TaxID=45954 RepID=A0A9D4G2X7_DREPO|nr:hypothetical protein DPMN_137946 [Dreissena polymorpha]
MCIGHTYLLKDRQTDGGKDALTDGRKTDGRYIPPPLAGTNKCSDKVSRKLDSKCDFECKQCFTTAI